MHCFLLKNFNPQKDLINFFNNSFILEIFHPDLLFFSSKAFNIFDLSNRF